MMHAGCMIFDTDFCCCTRCEQKWVLTDKGWRAVPAHYDEVADLKPPENEYQKFRRRGGSPRESGARLKRPVRNIRRPRVS